MTRSFLPWLLAALVAVPAVARAGTPAEAAAKLRAFLDAVPAGPGYAVVVVDREHRLLDYARGERDAATGAPLSIDTPMYVASQTKAYMGLLAHVLDRRGVLSLDTTLAEQGLPMPAGVDASAWTLRDLLNHRVPIEADAITWLEAYVAAPDPASYPQLLRDFAHPRAPGYRYDNLGYNIYAAVLYRATGKRWQDWLHDEVFAPLRLARTSARGSDFARDALSSGHVWLGDGAWDTIAPKDDSVMQSAGGVFTSAGDMGRWLQLHLGAPAAGFDAGLLAAAHARGADIDPKAANAYELPCDGYAYGWSLCDFQGHRLYIHGGAYDGTRTLMAFAPDLGVGIGVFSNSDNMTGWLTSRTVVQYLQFLVDDPKAEKWAEARSRQYPERVDRLLASRRKKLADARADPAWGGWTWRPGSAALRALAGRYRADGLPAEATLAIAGSRLQLQLGQVLRTLEPASADLFAARGRTLDPPEALRIVRDAGGEIVGFDYQDLRFRRRAGE